MRTNLLLAFVILSTLLIAGQEAHEFTGKVSSVGKNSVSITGSKSQTKAFAIDEKLLRESGLKQDYDVTVFYTPEKQITAVQIGDQMWHQRQCSRESCKCTKHDCKPSCHCKD
jgi:hypothetical protein